MCTLTWNLRDLHSKAALVSAHKLQSPGLYLGDLLGIHLVPT